MNYGRGQTKNWTFSPTGWLRMRVWRMNLWWMKSTIISWCGSDEPDHSKTCLCHMWTTDANQPAYLQSHHLFYLLPRLYNAYRHYIQNFNIQPSFCSWFVLTWSQTSEDRFSSDMVQICICGCLIRNKVDYLSDCTSFKGLVSVHLRH